MQKIHIIAIVMIVAAIGLFINAADDMSTYGNFQDAAVKGNIVKIAGTLSKDKEIIYNPEKDPNFFSFYIKDDKGVENKVILLKAKPTDFEKSEQIVITGKMNKGVFIASDILLKCPSKYKDEESFLKKESELGMNGY